MTDPDRAPETDDDQPQEPTPEQIEARARRADRATRGALAAILALEAVVVLLVPRAIALTSGLGTTRTVILIALAVVLVAVAGLLRRPWGIAVGSAMQVLFTATGVMITTMFVVGVIFAAIWLRLLMLRHEIVGSPGGLRLLAG
ncbi:DUF4233 domain-containing protein [uncultured Jatrophihabitans sp.]|uniref:DUF4233 domain-containing protein n=1 Tax=uncultured Jatrophihabitans sp. TaxID=1610747 RepID=UPI0035CA6ADA